MRLRLRIFCLLTVLTFITTLACLLSILKDRFDDNDWPEAASIALDEEELRFAHAQTVLHELRRSWSPDAVFTYSARAYPRSQMNSSVSVGLKFAILTPNRQTHVIDDYEPTYLTETVASLLEAIHNDIIIHGKQFSSVSIALCPTEDDLHNFSELKSVASYLPVDSIKPRPKSLGSLDIMCRTILDAGNCLLSTSSADTTHSHVILLEDDMMAVTDLLLNLQLVLRDIKALDGTASYIGAVQLWTDKSNIVFSHHDLWSLFELFTAVSITTILIWTAYFGLCANTSIRPLFIFCWIFALMSLWIILLGRYRLLTWFHILLSMRSFIQVQEARTAAAMMFTSEAAYAVGQHLANQQCESQHYHHAPLDKAQIIHRFLTLNKTKLVYSTFPSLFFHRGLYSIYTKSANPFVID